MRYIFLTLFVFALFATAFSREKQPEPPRLVIGIKIDGLQSEHLLRMWKYFSAGGFRKIVSESGVVENLHHNQVSAGNAADVATLMTGTYPCYHGVTDDYFYNVSDNRLYSILFDKNQVGIGTKEQVSAHFLRSSTFTDELILSNPLSRVHSVAIDAPNAVMMGGHAATSVSWMDDLANRWVTTAYYDKGLSPWADAMNVDGQFKTLGAEKWTPSASISTFGLPTIQGSRTIPFSHNPEDKVKGNPNRRILKNTPMANTLVTRLATAIFDKEQLGVDKHTDVLMIQYSVKIPNQIGTELQFAEQEDMYIRLDRDIQSLLHTVIAKVGLENLFLFMVGDASGTRSPEVLRKKRIPSGFFNADRALALLNAYLMALYGEEKWVLGHYGKNIFLNRKKAEEKKLNWIDFQDQAIRFLMEFEGVQTAYTTTHIRHFLGEPTDVRTKFRHSYHKSTGGDIVFDLLPGWMEVDNQGQVLGEANRPQIFIPIYFMGKGAKLSSEHAVYDVIDVAPTLSDLMGVPRPNACIGKRMLLKE